MSADVFAAVIESAVTLIKSQTIEYNVLADKVIHADNSTKLLHEVRDESETADEHILTYRKWYADVCDKILANQAGIEKYIVEAGLVDTTPVDVPAAIESAKVLAKQIKDLRTVVGGFPGGATSLEGLTELSKLPGVSRAGSSGANGGTGIWRPRIASITLNGVSVFDTKGDKHVANMTVLKLHLAKEFKVDVEVTALQELLLAASGTKDLASLNGAPVSFTYVTPVNDAGETVRFDVVVIPSVPIS